MIPTEYLVIYFVSLGLCLLSTIYKTACFKSMLCRQILGSVFWSLIPIMNTFKALLWLLSLAVTGIDKLRTR
ncbi:hypothetical protein SAMN05192560_0478 [Methylobacillus rhizosphaerae]|uniref:Uncharacterized protein n=1 Tax=Methylobacillus rhizosphaerae TaxID=551994 RepID=A0A238YDE8_9PROT|nr:hypothetical protein [Methylobacillus rhizosphaerae]SNR68634.1 hypothetical protein SAMN05192560_0478 [Methylobacillus rhizosphaerae]